MVHHAIEFIKPAIPKFSVGDLVATPKVQRRITRTEMLNALQSHIVGNWGILDDEDKAANEAALKNGGRLLSAYFTVDETKFWVLTEADRSRTTFLFPEEY